MTRAPCCDKQGLRKGPWTPEEDEKLVKYITVHGEGNWSSVPKKAGLVRCGKSCRLRWANYLRPDLKRGIFTDEEEKLILSLHKSIGNRWARIAQELPGRTDNDIKNHWNTRMKRRLKDMGIDPSTHMPLSPMAELAEPEKLPLKQHSKRGPPPGDSTRKRSHSSMAEDGTSSYDLLPAELSQGVTASQFLGLAQEVNWRQGVTGEEESMAESEENGDLVSSQTSSGVDSMDDEVEAPASPTSVIWRHENGGEIANSNNNRICTSASAIASFEETGRNVKSKLERSGAATMKQCPGKFRVSGLQVTLPADSSRHLTAFSPASGPVPFLLDFAADNGFTLEPSSPTGLHCGLLSPSLLKSSPLESASNEKWWTHSIDDHSLSNQLSVAQEASTSGTFSTETFDEKMTGALLGDLTSFDKPLLGGQEVVREREFRSTLRAQKVDSANWDSQIVTDNYHSDSSQQSDLWNAETDVAELASESELQQSNSAANSPVQNSWIDFFGSTSGHSFLGAALQEPFAVSRSLGAVNFRASWVPA